MRYYLVNDYLLSFPDQHYLREKDIHEHFKTVISQLPCESSGSSRASHSGRPRVEAFALWPNKTEFSGEMFFSKVKVSTRAFLPALLRHTLL